ncbi:MAG: DUF5067 domain-containing protein [Clostridia bacterium]|nr:DUF5067 domain-containing protein [Clostridia bacterium]
MKNINIILACLLVVVFSIFALASTESGNDTSVADQGVGNVGSGSKSESKDNAISVGEAEKEETEEEKNRLGDYSVVIDSCRLAKTYDNKDAVIVKYIFTNVSNDDAVAFYVAFDENVYQDGVGLNEAYILKDSEKYSADNQTKEIKKGASIEVEVAYELNDSSTDIEVEIKEFFSFDDKILKKTFKIK